MSWPKRLAWGLVALATIAIAAAVYLMHLPEPRAAIAIGQALLQVGAEPAGTVALPHRVDRPGETVTVSKLPDGAIEVRPAHPKGRISDVFNSLKRKGAPRLSIKQMKKIAEEGWARKR